MHRGSRSSQLGNQKLCAQCGQSVGVSQQGMLNTDVPVKGCSSQYRAATFQAGLNCSHRQVLALSWRLTIALSKRGAVDSVSTTICKFYMSSHGITEGKIDFEARRSIQVSMTPTDYPEHHATELQTSSWSLALSLDQ